MKAARTIMIILLLLISMQLASAWGINPARQRADHTTEQQYLSVTLENAQRSEGYFKVSFSGELAPYAKYNGPAIYLDKDTQDYIIPFTLKLPQNLQGGTQKLSVNIEQIAGGSTSTVNSLTMLVADVNVDVPYDDDEVLAQLAIGMAQTTQPTPMTISIRNMGKEAVAVWADFVIKGPTNEELASWQTDKQIFQAQGNGKIATEWADERQPGLYHAQVTLHYADKELVLRQTFMVGSKEVISENINSDNFRLGGIAPLDITVRNKWNEMITGVFADVYVLGKDGDIIQSFKTATENVDGLGRNVLKGYWDTAKLIVGEYDLNIIVNYDGGQTQASYPVVVKADELQVMGTPTGQVTGKNEDSGEGIGQNSLLIMLLLALVITNVIIITYFRRMKKK